MQREPRAESGSGRGGWTGRVKQLFTVSTLQEYYVELGIVVLAVIVHFFHLGTFPAFFIDEGTYTGFALQFAQTGSPTGIPGNFFFHPFLGWILEGGYLKLILFPQAWNSSPILLYSAARALPAVLSIVDVPLLYLVVLRVYRRTDYAILSAGLFAVTPLSARYLRMVLLDCFLLFFLLMSLALLVSGRKKPSVILSGIAYGVATLSKLPALFFLPAFAALFLANSYDRLSLRTSNLKTFALWLASAGLTFAVWPAYAVASGHYNDFRADLSFESVKTGQFALTLIVQRLATLDVFLFVGLAGIVYGLYKRDIVGFAFTVSYIGIFLARNFQASSYYLIPVLPFISVLACILVTDAVALFSKHVPLDRFSISRQTLIRIVSIVLIIGLAGASVASARGSAVSAQSAAINYVVANAPDGSLVISSPAYAWTLRSMRPTIVSYDWYYAPWSSLPRAPKTYLLVDPGFAGQVQEVPPLGALYNQTRSEVNFTGPVPMEVRSTNSTATIP